MTGPGVDRSVDLADEYAAWVRELGRHWAADGGGCVCGAAVSPCPAEVIAQRKVTDAEAEWRAEGRRRVAAQQAGAAQDGVPGGAPPSNRPAPSDPRRWT